MFPIPGQTSAIISKVRGMRSLPRDSGVSCGGCPEQLAYLVFPKTPDESSRPPCKRGHEYP